MYRKKKIGHRAETCVTAECVETETMSLIAACGLYSGCTQFEDGLTLEINYVRGGFSK
jgi:hypothetical protein